MPFRVIFSLILLTATVNSHLDNYNTAIAKKLQRDIYVDNIVTGANKVSEGIEIYQNAKTFFKKLP